MRLMRFINELKIGKLFLFMLLFIPISIYLAIFTGDSTLTFIFAILAIIPLARIIGILTNQIVLQANPAIAGLVSATFGNIIELIIAVIALNHGLIRLVQASIVGSIIGNILLLVGLSIFIGGLKYKHQRFNKEAVSVSSTMLIIVVVAITIPSVYAFFNSGGEHIMLLSDSVALIMAVIYIAGLIFAFKTHKDLFDSSDEIRATKEKPVIGITPAIITLFFITVIVAIQGELLVNSIKDAAFGFGITETFVGVVIIAIVTNIAEKSSAIQFAIQNKLDVSIEIGLSSAIQIALFVVPILILVSQIFGFGFLLVFSMFEIVAIMLSVLIVNHLSTDGRCNWLEGAQLISVYLILAIAFFFI